MALIDPSLTTRALAEGLACFLSVVLTVFKVDLGNGLDQILVGEFRVPLELAPEGFYDQLEFIDLRLQFPYIRLRPGNAAGRVAVKDLNRSGVMISAT